MSGKKIIIVSTGNIARLVRHYIGGDLVIAFSAHERFITEDKIDGLPVIPIEHLAILGKPDDYLAFVAIGYQGMNVTREAVLTEVTGKGYEPFTCVSELALVAKGIEIGHNCLVSPMAIVEQGARIGNNVFIRCGAYIGHDTVIEDNCWLGAKAIIGGNSHVGRNSFVGYGGIIRNGMKLGQYCLVGAGAVIGKSTGDYEVWKSPHALLDKRSSLEVKI